MAQRPLSVASFRWDTTSALLDGAMGFDGLAIDLRTASLPEIFETALRTRDYDVSELGLTYYLRSLDAGGPYVALPVFPARAFRHSSVWVGRDAGISEPADLNGRVIGEFGLFGQDSGLFAKGVLRDECGFDARTCRWVIGGLDEPMDPFDFVPNARPEGYDITPAGAALSDLLTDGRIDALFTSNVPQAVLDGSPDIRPLFADHEQRERDYFARTRIFPVMHTVVVRRDVLAARPGLARQLYAGYEAAKQHCADTYRRNRRVYQVTTMVPWMNSLVERDLALLGQDWWPYGVRANRDAIEAVLRYHHEQGLTRRRYAVEEVFAPELLDT